MHSNLKIMCAIAEIDKRHDGKPITMIEMEDGSGNNYNYKLVKDEKPYFIRISDKISSISLEIVKEEVREVQFPESKL